MAPSANEQARPHPALGVEREEKVIMKRLFGISLCALSMAVHSGSLLDNYDDTEISHELACEVDVKQFWFLGDWYTKERTLTSYKVIGANLEVNNTERIPIVESRDGLFAAVFDRKEVFNRNSRAKRVVDEIQILDPDHEMSTEKTATFIFDYPKRRVTVTAEMIDMYEPPNSGGRTNTYNGSATLECF